MKVRPLHCVAPGHWTSHDGSWTFLRHESDPHPKRWFAYEGDEPDASTYGQPSLREAVREIEREEH